MAVSSHGAGALSRLRAEQTHLTPALRRLAEVVLASPQEAIYQSVTELADLAGVGEASVIRLCRDLGFKGFQDFKLALAADLARALDRGASGRRGARARDRRGAAGGITETSAMLTGTLGPALAALSATPGRSSCTGPGRRA